MGGAPCGSGVLSVGVAYTGVALRCVAVRSVGVGESCVCDGDGGALGTGPTRPVHHHHYHRQGNVWHGPAVKHHFRQPFCV